MVCLLLDSCAEHGVVAFYEGSVQKFLGTIPEGVHNSKYMMVEIDKGCQALGLRPADLKYIAVAVGPGSYTGIRVGVVIAKTLSYAAKIPLVPLSSLSAYVPEDDGPFVSLIDARIGGAYLRLGRKLGDRVEWLSEPELCELPALKQRLNGVETIVTPSAKGIQKKVEALYPDLPLRWIESKPNVACMAREAEDHFLAGNITDALGIEIVYLRKTQAEIERDSRAQD